MASRDHFPTAAAFLPHAVSLPALREAASRCRGCDLYKSATQTVFGEGTKKAAVMLIGEQPGDKEDIAGRPFVGPAGRLLDEALLEAGIDRSEVYVTNAVKHFSWEPDTRGKRRIHKKPRYSEIQACRPWLDAEITAVRPRVVICMGTTAAKALLGRLLESSASGERSCPPTWHLGSWQLCTLLPSCERPTSAPVVNRSKRLFTTWRFRQKKFTSSAKLHKA